MLLIMVAYNFFIFLVLRDKSYIYYVLFVITLTLNNAIRQGFFEQYIFPENSHILTLHLSSIFSLILSLQFATTFLDLKNKFPILTDLILLDIKMPDMDGYEVCQHIKANEKTCDIPVIFISGLEDVMDKVKAFQMGGVDYIVKPFATLEVIARVENHLQMSQKFRLLR